jgi:hypothetical protein
VAASPSDVISFCHYSGVLYCLDRHLLRLGCHRGCLGESWRREVRRGVCSRDKTGAGLRLKGIRKEESRQGMMGLLCVFIERSW